jgi:DNA-binding transcriptional MerR regulator
MTRMTRSPWTLDELAERVGAALSVDYDGPASRRVREVPDQRAIRYYTTIGLVDRPAAMRGRTALYSRRHLLQLVAIKRLQAGGLSLARIQRELAGATEEQLEHVASIPPTHEPARASVEGEVVPAAAALTTSAPAAPCRAFWKQPPAPPPRLQRAASTAAAAAEGSGGSASGPEAGSGVVAIQGVRLGDEVTLLVEGARPLGADEVAAIQAAAVPLLEVVRRERERS